MKPVRPHSLRAWWLAARPKTLSAALVGVVTALALALTDGTELLPHAALHAVLCTLFAALMQVASNFINDLIDFSRGTDGVDRLGPERACQQGWISPRAMTYGIAAVLGVAALTGLTLLCCLLLVSSLPPLVLIFRLVALGAVCGAGAFLYTTWFSAWGLGDVLVLLFFGLIPVGGTYFALTDRLPLTALFLGIAVGLVVDTLLVVNNFRDRDTDRSAGKRTLVVRLGARGGSLLYLGLGLAGCLMIALTDLLLHSSLSLLTLAPLALFLPFHLATWRSMVRIGHGRALNRILALTSRNILLFALSTVLGLAGFVESL